MEKEFIPVILGIDVGAYSVARTFYEHYKVKSIIIGKYLYWMTSYSKICICHTIDNMTEEKLINYLIDLKNNYQDKELLLFGCSEDYVDIIIRNKEVLDNYYVIPTVNLETLNKIVQKEGFYEICEKEHINYPKTFVINKDNYLSVSFPFDYPIVAKASNKAKYQRINFNGKMKVFIFNNKDEYQKAMMDAYASGYDDDFVIQEYISGPDSNMRVVTCFCDENSDVIFSSVGKVILEEKGPNVTGNYSSIINTKDDAILEDAKKFLKSVGYVGYANFDIKYDDHTKKYYFFEINVRLGRSNFYNGSGNFNYLAPIVDSFIYKKSGLTYQNDNISLYRIIPFYIIKKYVKDKELIKEIKNIKRNNPLDYSKDMTIKRKIYIYLALINHIGKFKKYYE